jgi:hypothetical protein
MSVMTKFAGYEFERDEQGEVAIISPTGNRYVLTGQTDMDGSLTFMWSIANALLDAQDKVPVLLMKEAAMHGYHAALDGVKDCVAVMEKTLKEGVPNDQPL